MKATSQFIVAAAIVLGGGTTAHSQDASVRINVTGIVPVACSSGEALSRSVEGSTVRATFDARCNTVHEMTISGIDESEMVVRVNDAQTSSNGSLVRPAYFDTVTVVTVDLSSEAEAQKVAQSIAVRLTPLS